MSRHQQENELFDLKWHVAEGKYKWLNTTEMMREPFEQPKPKTSSIKPFLIIETPLSGTTIARVYRPFDNPTLYLRFADTVPTQDGILEFANRYGMLGSDTRHMVLVRACDDPSREILGTGEPLEIWWGEIHALRRALRLWRLVQLGDQTGLTQLIKWQSNPDPIEAVRGCYYESRPDVGAYDPDNPWMRQWIATDSDPEFLNRFETGDVFKPALFYVQRVVNEHLSGRVSPRMLWSTGDTRLGLHMVPNGLIGAIWLQLASAITGNKKYRQCRRCDTYFELSPDAARTNRLFCSDACKSKAYRERRAMAMNVSGTVTPSD